MDNYRKIVISCLVGTRPEVIKMAPIIKELQGSRWAEVIVINTGQHNNILLPLFKLFGIEANINLQTMAKNQSLSELHANLCKKLNEFLQTTKTNLLLAVGDTASVFSAAITAFYNKIPFGHIEAGMRTYDMHSPYPEEMHRSLVAKLTTWHFAPTELEKNNLSNELVDASKIVVTGNTVIDALFWIKNNKIKKPSISANLNSKFILITLHRRESVEHDIQEICQALAVIANLNPDILLVLPIHPNPKIQAIIATELKNKSNIHLLEPVPYEEFIWLMQNSFFIMTDSGGIQEEAPALNKFVLVLRNKTERKAIIEQKLGILTGTNRHNIINLTQELIKNNIPQKYNEHKLHSPYGDGYAAQKIVSYLQGELTQTNLLEENSKIEMPTDPWTIVN